MRPLVKAVVILLAVAALLLAVALFHDFDAPWVADALGRLAARRGVELEVEEASLNLRRGVLLEGVVARSEAAGERIEASLGRLVLEHRLAPLLRGRIVVDRLLLERPDIEMISARPAVGVESPEAETPVAAPAAPDEGGPERLELRVAEVGIVDGRWTSRSEADGGTTVLAGLDLALRDISVDAGADPLLLAVSGEGWLEADSLALDDRRVEDVAASFAAERGRYHLDGFDAATGAGRLRIEEIEVDLSQDPYRYRFEMTAPALDLAAVLGLGAGLGEARLELLGNGEGPGVDGAVAEMSLELAAGTLPSTRILAVADRIAGTALDAAAYEATQLDVALVGGRLEVDPFELVTAVGRLRMGGVLTPGGSVDLSLSVGVPGDLFDRTGVSTEVLDLLTGADGWLDLPLRVTGTVEAPRFGPDVQAIAHRTRRLGEEAGEALRQRARGELRALIARRQGR